MQVASDQQKLSRASTNKLYSAINVHEKIVGSEDLNYEHKK